MFIRFLLCLALAFHLAVAVGDTCSEGCADDREDGSCAPDCQDCTCCAHGASAMVKAALATGLPEPRAAQLGGGDQDAPPSPEPQEPEQVPKV